MKRITVQCMTQTLPWWLEGEGDRKQNKLASLIRTDPRDPDAQLFVQGQLVQIEGVSQVVELQPKQLIYILWHVNIILKYIRLIAHTQTQAAKSE